MNAVRHLQVGNLMTEGGILISRQIISQVLRCLSGEDIAAPACLASAPPVAPVGSDCHAARWGEGVEASYCHLHFKNYSKIHNTELITLATLKCTVQWQFIHSQCCAAIVTI